MLQDQETEENAEPKGSEPASSTEGMLGRLLVQTHHVDVPASVRGSGLKPGPCLGLLFCFSSSGQEVSWHFKYRHLIPDRSNLLWNFRILCTLVGWENRDFSSHLLLLVLLQQYQTMLEEHSSAEKTLLLPVCRTLAHPLNSTSCPKGFFWFQSSRRNNLRLATACGYPRPLHSSWF